MAIEFADVLAYRQKNPAADTQDSTWSKVSREVSLYGMGTLEGVAQSGKDAIDHPGRSLVKMALAAGLAAGIVVASRGRMTGTAVELLSGALLLSAVPKLAKDGGKLIQAGIETWDSPQSYEKNKAKVAGIVGPLVVDSALYMAGGYAGSTLATRMLPLPKLAPQALAPAQDMKPVSGSASDRLGDQQTLMRGGTTDRMGPPEVMPTRLADDGWTRGPYPTERTAQVYVKNVDKVVRITATDPRYPGQDAVSGSGFFVSDEGMVATNAHVVKNADTISVHTTDGRVYDAVIKNIDPGRDVAMLRIRPQTTGQVFPHVDLSVPQPSLRPNVSRVVAMGHPYSAQSVQAAPGIFEGVRPYYSEVGGVSPGLQIRARFEPGISGGPVFSESSGQVIGIATAGNGHETAMAIPIENLHSFMYKHRFMDFLHSLIG